MNITVLRSYGVGSVNCCVTDNLLVRHDELIQWYDHKCSHKTAFPAVNIFLPLTNSWVRIMTGDLPQPRYSCTAVQLSSNTMIVIGGRDNQDKDTKTVFIATVTV